MNRLFDKLNLRPHERRLVVLVGLLVFVLLNFWFVKPHFGEWGRLQQKRADVEREIKRYETEIAKREGNSQLLAELRKSGAEVSGDEQGIDLFKTINNQANLVGLYPGQYVPSSAGLSNQFFVERTLRINGLNAAESNLLDFLFNLGAGDSLIRVSSMSLVPDQPRRNINADFTFVASYKQKAPAAFTPARNTNLPAATPPKTTPPPKANPPTAAARPAPLSRPKPAAATMVASNSGKTLPFSGRSPNAPKN